MMSFRPSPDLLRKLDFKDPATWLGTWFGCGLMRPMPGTWGTLGAVPFGVGLMLWGGLPALLTGLAVVTLLGFWACARLQDHTGDHDASYIVIDEVAGLFIALIPAALTPLSVLAAFVFFRFFDIVKPWPVSWLDKKINHSAGVMLDDMMAGIYAALCLIGLHYAGFNF